MSKGKHTYLVRLTLLDSIDDIDPHIFAHRISFGGLRIDHGEVYNERDFVKKVWEKSGLNEIDLDDLFHDILHISEEEVDEYLFSEESK
jgi:hypothetical protein